MAARTIRYGLPAQTPTKEGKALYAEEYETGDVTIRLAAFGSIDLEGVADDNLLNTKVREAVGGPYAAMQVQVKCPEEAPDGHHGFVTVGVLFMAAEKTIENAMMALRGEKPEGVFFEVSYEDTASPDVVTARQVFAQMVEKHDAKPLW